MHIWNFSLLIREVHVFHAKQASRDVVYMVTGLFVEGPQWEWYLAVVLQNWASMLWDFKIRLKHHKGGKKSAHPILKSWSIVRALVFPTIHHWVCGTYNLLYFYARSFSKQSKFIKAKIKHVCPLGEVVLCAACKRCVLSLWTWHTFCSSLWEGSIWSEWFVTHFWQLRNEML